MLCNRFSSRGNQLLAFIHGFLGQKEDWNKVISYLPQDLEIKTINLPGHANTKMSSDLLFTIKEMLGKSQFLIGYSAGGRIALQLKDRFPEDFQKLILISTHPGLKDEQQRLHRWEQDLLWIKKLENDSFADFLQEWYAQPIFETLHKNPKLFEALLIRRKGQNPHSLADFLTRFSLGKTPTLPIPKNTTFICGDQDLKYVSLYHTLPLYIKVYTARESGHAVHIENPCRCAEIIKGVIYDDN